VLEKTLALLRRISPGTYVAEDQNCYDEAEMEALAQALVPVLWSPSKLRKKLQSRGVNVVPADFYSPIPTIDDIESSFAAPYQTYDYIFNHSKLREFLTILHNYSSEFDPPLASGNRGIYSWDSPSFSYSDAMAYYCFIRHLKPKRIIEIGAGASTVVADAACKANGVGEIVCVEPFPPGFLKEIASVRSVIESPVQQLPYSFFNEQLADGDILFIDSTHTVKHGSDCLHLYLRVLPQLPSSIFVHVHDVWLPRTRSLNDLRDRQIYWTEEYLVMAYLIDNYRTEVLYGSNYHFIHNKERLTDFMHGRFQPGGGSLWFSQQARMGQG
jgi:hypothetical protein